MCACCRRPGRGQEVFAQNRRGRARGRGQARARGGGTGEGAVGAAPVAGTAAGSRGPRRNAGAADGRRDLLLPGGEGGSGHPMSFSRPRAGSLGYVDPGSRHPSEGITPAPQPELWGVSAACACQGCLLTLPHCLGLKSIPVSFSL